MTIEKLTTLERIRDDYSAAGMEELFLRLDRLHDFAAAGRLGEVTPLTRGELRGWMEDLIYTAREIVREMDLPAWERLREMEMV